MDIYEKILTALKNIPSVPDEQSVKQGNQDTNPTDREQANNTHSAKNVTSDGGKKRQIVEIVIAALSLLVALLAWLLPRH